MNLPEDTGSQKGPSPTGEGTKAITVRQLAVVAGVVTVQVLVWRRTGGDYLLSIAAIPFVYSSLNRWIAQ